MSAPSGWTIQTVMSVAGNLAARLEADGVDTDEADLIAYLREEGADVGTLLLRLARAAQEAKADKDAIVARRVALDARKQRAERKAEECRAAMHGIMDALGMRKFRHAEVNVSIADGRPGVVVTDLDALPAALVRITKAAAMDEIKAALARGEEVPGVETTNGAPVLTIRSS